MRALTIGSSADGIEVAGVATDGSITPELLDGIFWGKPRGSVETADLNRQRQDFNSFLRVLAPLMQINPTLGAIFQTMPAAKALIKTALKVNRVQDIQSFIGPEANGVFEQMQMMQDPRMKLLMAAAGGMASPQPQMPGMGGAMPNEGAPQEQSPGGSVQ